MPELIIDLLLLAGWSCLFTANRRRQARAAREQNLILVLALPTTLIMEIINEGWARFAYYPSPALRFPGFNFPAAILLAGGLFAWSVFVASDYFAKRIIKNKTPLFYLVQLFWFMVMLASSWLIEPLFIRLGYWRYYDFSGYSFRHLGGVYGYYLLFSLPPVLLAKLLCSRLRK